MTRRELATLACKILGLYLLTQAATYGSEVIYMAIVSVCGFFTTRGFQWDDLMAASVLAVPSIPTLVIGLFFWFRASRLAARMVSDDPSPVTGPNLTLEAAAAIAFAAVGVLLLVPVLQNLASSFIRIIRGSHHFSEWWSSPNWQASFWSSILGVAFSLWLIFGSRGFARLVLWARNVGTKAPDEWAGANTPPPANDIK